VAEQPVGVSDPDLGQPVGVSDPDLGQPVGVVAPSLSRPVWVEVDVAAIRHNARILAAAVAPAALCAVVKADAYGHGALAVARAALEGGASCLAVATVDEGVALRRGSITAPILLLSEPVAQSMLQAWQAGLTPTLYSLPGIVAARAAAGQGADHHGSVPAWGSAGTDRAGRNGPWPVHVKVDTGMHRVGADPEDLAAVVAAVDQAPELEVGGLWTHLAVADGDGDEDRIFTFRQLRLFEASVEQAGLADMPGVVRHAANSAAALAYPASRYDMVRCGIALYGVAPGPSLQALVDQMDLRPALSWKAAVSHVRLLPAGARPSYGRARPLPAPAAVATVPVGYADGIPRRYFDTGGTVLIGGQSRPLAGVVTMDQIVVDCGSDVPAVGDPVVLVGRQGTVQLGAADWAKTLGTIGYEILCGIGPRVPRVVVDSEHPAPPVAGDAKEGQGR